MDFDITPGGVVVPLRPKLIVPTSPWLPTRVTGEMLWQDLEKDVRRLYDKIFKAPTVREKLNVVAMAGSLANFSSKKIQDLLHGATAYTAPATLYVNLWASALDDTFN